MRAFGAGGPSVDTVLAEPTTQPGQHLEGQVRIEGGDNATEIEYVSLGLATRVEGENDAHSLVEFARLQVSSGFPLGPGERRDIPFRFPVPWETPVTEVYGQHLRGMSLGLRTE